MGNIKLKSLKPGDVLEIDGIPGHNFVPHWAVYVGDGDIVHFTKEKIRTDDLRLLSKSRSFGVKVRNCHDNKCQPKEWDEIVDCARGQVDTESAQKQWSGCKEFAMWCRYGDFIQNNVEAVADMNVACFSDNDEEEETDTRLLHDAFE